MLLSPLKDNLRSCVTPPGDSEDFEIKWLRYFNQAAERIYNSGKWKGTLRTIEIMVGSDGFIELPTTYEAVIAVRSPEGTPMELFPESLEFSTGGPGFIGPVGSEGGPGWGLIDRGDGLPTARRYRVPSNVATTLETVSLRVKLATPTYTSDDTVEVVPPNMGAWKMALLALSYEDENDLERADIYWGRCFTLLNQELKQFRGNPKVVLNIHPWGLARSGRIYPMY